MSLTVLPTVIFDSAGSSDTTASGAGAVNLSGTAAATTSGLNSVVLTVDGPDLSGLAADGSELMWVLSSSGRQFSRISAINNGTKTVTCEDNWANTEGGRTWGIGGKRATIDNANSRKLFTADVKPGWTIQINANMTIAGGTITLPNGGDTTTGWCTITGNADSGSQPILTISTNAAILTIGASTSKWKIKRLSFQCSAGSKTTSYGITTSIGSASSIIVDNCIFGDATNQLQSAILGANNCNWTILDSEIKNCLGAGLSFTNQSTTGVEIVNCKIHDNAAGGISSTVAFGTGIQIIDSSIYSNSGGAGVSLTAADAVGGPITIVRCTIHGTISKPGIDLGANVHERLTIVNNNITANGTQGVAGTATQALMDTFKALVDYNNFGTGATANASGPYQNITAGAHDLTVDPGYVNAGGTPPNFAVGTGDKAKGYPDATRTIGGNTGGTTTYQDIGAAQRQEPAGGSGPIGQITGARSIGTY